jgi:hypothetical protein
MIIPDTSETCLNTLIKDYYIVLSVGACNASSNNFA